MRRKRFFLFVLLALLIACEPEATTATPAATAVLPAVTVAPAAEAEENNETVAPIVEDVTFAGAEDLVLHATYYQPGGEPPFPGVLLLHMIGDDRTVWAETRTGFARTLAENGYAVLAVDMRGHGESGSTRNWTLAETDLQQAWLTLTMRDKVDATHTAVIGASIGANMALRTAATRPELQTAVLLSPGLDYRRVTTEDALAAYGGRPLLIVASRDDTYSATSSRTLQGQAPATAVLTLYDDAGHGTDMFAAAPELADAILDWLHTHLHPLAR